jgi:hypothetical protein
MPTPGLGHVARTLGWLALAVGLALGGAGLAGQLSHPPGGPNREELTYAADGTLRGQLDELATQLTGISPIVDGLADDARAALTAVAAGDGEALQVAVTRGTNQANLAQSTVAGVRSSLAGLPGDGHDATAVYANDTLVRRAALLAALDSVGGLGPLWDSVTVRASDAASLIVAIRNHDTTVASAAAQGVQAKYAAALELMTQAGTILDQISELRRQIVAGSDATVLDDWIARNLRHDTALTNLYKALRSSGGQRNPVVDAAYREELLARQDLPKDNREIVVIVAEVAQAGLNQAVIAIDDARGRIDQALATVAPS